MCSLTDTRRMSRAESVEYMSRNSAGWQPAKLNVNAFGAKKREQEQNGERTGEKAGLTDTSAATHIVAEQEDSVLKAKNTGKRHVRVSKTQPPDIKPNFRSLFLFGVFV